MTASPGAGDRRRPAGARFVFGAQANRPHLAHASRTRPSANDRHGNNERHPLTKSGGASSDPNELLEHLALAMTLYVRHLRQDGLQVPPTVDELTALLVRFVQTSSMATPAEHMGTTWTQATEVDR